jgi:hypothetical protein
MLAHPTIVPYLNTLLGQGFRMDHAPLLLTQGEGAGSGNLHRVGAADGKSGFDPHAYYVYARDRMFCGLTVVSWQLVDVPEGAGGFCAVPGSHKANRQCPASMVRFERHQEHVKQITARKGDVIIFTENLQHGTLPWNAEHDRRSVLWRYSPGNLGFHPSGYSVEEDSFRFEHSHRWPDEWMDGLSDAGLAVLEPPYASFRADIGRPLLDAGGVLQKRGGRGSDPRERGGRSNYSSHEADATRVLLPVAMDKPRL